MAIKYKLDEDARDQLDRRSIIGKDCIRPALDPGEELETGARDAVSDILTALFGPAGYCVLGKGWTGPEASGPYDIVLDEERGTLARTFLDMALESWEGDAEDYTAEAVTVDNPLLPEDKPTTSVRSVVTARYLEVQKQYEEEVEPGVSDNSVLEAERDTLGWVLDQLDVIEQG